MIQNNRWAITEMRVADLSEVIALERLAYTAPWPEAVYRQELRNEHAQFTVVRYRQQLLGYSGIWHLVDLTHIATLVSSPQVRRKGIGELLLTKIIDQAQIHLMEAVTLEVRPSNRPAQNLYAKYGFEIVGRRKAYYPDNGEDALIMTTPSLNSQSYRELLRQLRQNLWSRLISLNLDESE